MPRPCQEGPGSAIYRFPLSKHDFTNLNYRRHSFSCSRYLLPGGSAPGDDARCPMAKSPEEGMASLIQNLEAKTGKSLGAWVEIARGASLSKHKEIVEFLKQKHGLTHGYANQVAMRALAAADAPAAGSTDLVEAQYQGAKAALRPVYEALVAAVRGLWPGRRNRPQEGEREPAPLQAVRPDPALDGDAGRCRAYPQGRAGRGPSGGVGQLQRHVHSSRESRKRSGRGPRADRLAATCL